jgi:hypothetical protein
MVASILKRSGTVARCERLAGHLEEHQDPRAGGADRARGARGGAVEERRAQLVAVSQQEDSHEGEVESLLSNVRRSPAH